MTTGELRTSNAANQGLAKKEARRHGSADEVERMSETITDEIRDISDEAEPSEDQGIQWDNARKDHQRTTTPSAQEMSKGKEL